MICKECCENMADFFCDCRKNLNEKIYCSHINLMILINKPDHIVPRTKKTLSRQQPIILIDNTQNEFIDFQEQDIDKIEIINSNIEKKLNF